MRERIQEDFLSSFPEIYREQRGVLSRYLKVLSSVYDEAQEAVRRRAEILDVEKADSERLIQYAAWLGLDCGDERFKEEELRRIVRHLIHWNRKKGTKKVVQEIMETLYEEEVFVQEKKDGEAVLIMQGRRSRAEKKKMLFLLEQFIPAGIRLKILDGSNTSCMGESSFVGVNSVLVRPDAYRMDIQAVME